MSNVRNDGFTSLAGLISQFLISHISKKHIIRIGQKCQIGDFWGYSGPNLATLWKSVSHFQFGGNLAFLGPKLTDFKVLPDLDVNFPQKSLILAFLADFWWFWIWIIWQRCGNGQIAKFTRFHSVARFGCGFSQKSPKPPKIIWKCQYFVKIV